MKEKYKKKNRNKRKTNKGRKEQGEQNICPTKSLSSHPFTIALSLSLCNEHMS